jgi:putative membrane protein
VNAAQDNATPRRPVVSAGEAGAIERRVAAFEAATGVEIVAAVERRSDVYPEVPWRAFALGAALAALAVLVGHALRAEWTTPGALLVQAVAILGTGAIAALGSAFVPSFGRLFIRDGRMREEVRQRAEVVFLAREMFATPGRDAILVLVSLFERHVVVVPDTAWRGRVSAAEWSAVVARMAAPLAQGRLAEAFDAGLAAIEALLAAKGVAGTRPRHLMADTLVQGDAAGGQP